ncbi:MAG: signal peptidase II [Sphingomonas sp. SCN 67-18]|mgnify:CR=1 FL=1|uniref:signal peptidase II n=1 Tax=uncultured Sphingomonas sp. TaxID=158754 RepID=UPI00086F4189|nr:signal peptidase II [Sphingomonas sp. SCN 67-18]ODU22114.1 MAG: signal peptidase II [Sphingomonas sp. SCN 67-18]
MADGTARNRGAGIAVALGVFLVDQAVKCAVTGPLMLEQRRSIEILPFFNLTWVENWGVSMGFLTANSDAQRWLLVGLTALISIGVTVWMWREKNRADILALGLVLGGAIGNIVDRVRFGHVVDYADLHFGAWRPFLVFNVADAAITIGVLILLIRALLMREKSDPAENVNA